MRMGKVSDGPNERASLRCTSEPRHQMARLVSHHLRLQVQPVPPERGADERLWLPTGQVVVAQGKADEPGPAGAFVVVDCSAKPLQMNCQTCDEIWRSSKANETS